MSEVVFKAHIERLCELLGEAIANVRRSADLDEFPEIKTWSTLSEDAYNRAQVALKSDENRHFYGPTLTCCNFAQTMKGKEVHGPHCPYIKAVARVEQLEQVMEVAFEIPFTKIQSVLGGKGLTGSVRRMKDLHDALEKLWPKEGGK